MAQIDVLVPAYNAEDTIRGSIQSILDQTFADIKVVIVNDGSTDRTGLILDDMAEEDARILVVHQRNGGIVDAMNAGLDHCVSEFVARHDADDIAFPERLELQLEYLLAHEECIAVSGRAFIINTEGVRTGVITDNGDPSLADPDMIPPIEPYLMHPFLMMRRLVIEKVGRYRHVFHAEDADLYWRSARFGSLVNLPNIFGEYRIHPGSVTGKSVLNGRVNAVHSQLAAISELRRRSGVQDIHFDKSLISRYHKAQSLQEIVKVASSPLNRGERDDLELGAVLKLFEMSLYRPYRLEVADCEFARGVIARNGRRSEKIRLGMDRLLIYVSAMLIKRRELELVWALTPLKFYPRIALHFARSRLRPQH